MSPFVRLVLVLHNHQPIGNFDGVFEQTYQDSYLPFLDVYEQYEGLPISLHTSGSLIEWLAVHHPEYLDRVAKLVEQGRVEVIGGPFMEPILTMIPSRDRVGQIRAYSQYLKDRLGAHVRGMWMPERVWEQSLASDIAEAGIQYTVLDDYHFRNAGWTPDQLNGYYVTEHDGRLLSVFPGSERLRYTIPFAEPQATIDHLRGIAETQPGAIVTFGDDGEKLGSWPDTKAHVYEHGWLRRFFEALQANQDWLKVTTPGEAVDNVAPLGRLYIPEASYREMTEWALPAVQQNAYHDAQHTLEDEGRWDMIQPFTRGGFWRNFKVRYPETNEMYCRMLQVSNRLAALRAQGDGGELLDAARHELYRGQCNCSYWHGAFGGCYLPHLRNAVYKSLIAADNLMDQHEGRGWEGDRAYWVEVDADDYNLDGRKEIRLASNRLKAFLAPGDGGKLYELDVRSICHNLLATLSRREEAYHRKVLLGPSAAGGEVASIHDRVVFKQEGLDQMLQYDSYARKSLVDHFYDIDASLESVAMNEAREQGDFVSGAFESKIRRNPDRMQALMWRDGNVDGAPVKVTKGVTLEAGGSELEITYLLENLPGDRPLHFSVELGMAGLPPGADDRYFHAGDGARLGDLGAKLDLADVDSLSLTDEWLGVDVGLTMDRPTSIWTYPIATVSQSEGGFELVNQSVVVQPHWILQADEHGRWSLTMRMKIDTSMAESRMHHGAEAATV
ncbi:alpha-amylase/4-alpha-glucanotransferase domain-containing protein [Posidoniimonas corsicana]|nr:alpha-amylase/4-alpha-glucanotransferase domain-containing protein [Posidoniimonas corsicana]